MRPDSPADPWEAVAQLDALRDALVDAFYDPDITDPDDRRETLDYSKVDWLGVIKDARRRIDELQARLAVAEGQVKIRTPAE